MCCDGIELNLSCPNILGKPQIGLDFESMGDSLSKLLERIDIERCAIGIKLPPYFDPVHWQMASNVIDNFTDKLTFLTCINSIGNALVVNPVSECTVIHPKQGFGGLGGPFIKYTALANVRAFYNIYKNTLGK